MSRGVRNTPKTGLLAIWNSYLTTSNAKKYISNKGRNTQTATKVTFIFQKGQIWTTPNLKGLSQWFWGVFIRWITCITNLPLIELQNCFHRISFSSVGGFDETWRGSKIRFLWENISKHGLKNVFIMCMMLKSPAPHKEGIYWNSQLPLLNFPCIILYTVGGITQWLSVTSCGNIWLWPKHSDVKEWLELLV